MVEAPILVRKLANAEFFAIILSLSRLTHNPLDLTTPLLMYFTELMSKVSSLSGCLTVQTTLDLPMFVTSLISTLMISTVLASNFVLSVVPIPIHSSSACFSSVSFLVLPPCYLIDCKSPLF